MIYPDAASLSHFQPFQHQSLRITSTVSTQDQEISYTIMQYHAITDNSGQFDNMTGKFDKAVVLLTPFLKIVDMDFSQICSSPGKFTLFQDRVSFPDAGQVFNMMISSGRNCHFFTRCAQNSKGKWRSPRIQRTIRGW